MWVGSSFRGPPDKQWGAAAGPEASFYFWLMSHSLAKTAPTGAIWRGRVFPSSQQLPGNTLCNVGSRVYFLRSWEGRQCPRQKLYSVTDKRLPEGFRVYTGAFETGTDAQQGTGAGQCVTLKYSWSRLLCIWLTPTWQQSETAQSSAEYWVEERWGKQR